MRLKPRILFAPILLSSLIWGAIVTSAHAEDLINVPPLNQTPISSDALEVRLELSGSLGLNTTMLQIERSSAGAKATFYYHGMQTYAQSILVSPEMGWVKFWKTFEELGAFQLIDQAASKGAAQVPPMDSEMVILETKSGSTYRSAKWLGLSYQKSADAMKFRRTMDFLADAFHVNFEATNIHRDGKLSTTK